MSDATDAQFLLDPRLHSDTIFLVDWTLCRLLLMDDARFPWLVLVPRVPGVEEIDDLDPRDCTRLAQEVRVAMQVLRDVAGRRKLNVAAIGNRVRQLHVHVVARSSADAAWPGTVWGHAEPVPYAPDARERLVGMLRLKLARAADTPAASA